MNKNKIFLPLLILITLGTAIFALALMLNPTNSQTDTDDTSSNSSESSSAYRDDLYIDYTKVRYNDKTYAFNTDIKTILFMGVDQTDDSYDPNLTVNAGRSDTMVLMIINNTNQDITLLNISRDTQALVNVYDSNGEYLSADTMSLALQYNYGDGEDFSCLITKNAVSTLLWEIPINYYLSMNLDSLTAIINNLGGIDVTMSNDYTYINPSFIEGETVHLDGELTETFVRYRDLTVVGSNEERMSRQEDFLTAFLAKLETLKSSDEDALSSLTQMILPYLLTDMDAETIDRILSYEVNSQTYRLPGETISGEFHDEFHVDKDLLNELILDLFYIEK